MNLLHSGKTPLAKAGVAFVSALVFAAAPVKAAEPAAGGAQGLGQIKSYLLTKLASMDQAAHDFVGNAAAYAKILAANGGDYDHAAQKSGDELRGLITKMQDNYKVFHNQGYETVEGVTAGVKRFVQFDNDLDAGVPKAEASTDSPAANLVLKGPDGKVIVDGNGNLFHYVIEPTLWGTKPNFLHPISEESAPHVHGLKQLPRAEVLTAASAELASRLDQLVDKAKTWEPTLDECVGALVWMTPTLNSYFDDWKESRYNPTGASGRYVAESRVLDMRGIMSSLQLSYNAVMPDVMKKDPALAKALARDYAGIISFLDRVDRQERRVNKLSIQEIDEMAHKAKELTDQLVPKLKQVVAILNLKLPPKPLLA